MAAVDFPPSVPSAVDRTLFEPPTDRPAHATDESWILSLLSANDGCLWQTEIVDLMEVSKATVSRRLTELETAGAVQRIEYRGRKVVWKR